MGAGTAAKVPEARGGVVDAMAEAKILLAESVFFGL